MYRYKGKIKRLKNNKRFIAIVITLAVAALILSSVLAYFISSSPPPRDDETLEYYVRQLEDQAKGYEESLKSAEDNVNLLTRTAETFYQLGFYYSLMSEPEKSISSYEKAADYYGKVLEKESGNVDIHFLRAVSAYSSGDDGLAEEELKKALELDPEHARSHYYYGVLLYYSKNNPKEAIAHWEKVVELNPEGEEALVEQAKSLIALAEEEMNKENDAEDEDGQKPGENTAGDE